MVTSSFSDLATNQHRKVAQACFPQLSASQVDSCIDAFNRFDLDGNGHIEADELLEVLKAAGVNATEQTATEQIAEVDADKNGTIEFQEFLQIVENLKAGKNAGSLGETLLRKADFFEAAAKVDEGKRQKNREEVLKNQQAAKEAKERKRREEEEYQAEKERKKREEEARKQLERQLVEETAQKAKRKGESLPGLANDPDAEKKQQLADRAKQLEVERREQDRLEKRKKGCFCSAEEVSIRSTSTKRSGENQS